jgi:uncharacterized membrane protein YgcG
VLRLKRLAIRLFCAAAWITKHQRSTYFQWSEYGFIMIIIVRRSSSSSSSSSSGGGGGSSSC